MTVLRTGALFQHRLTLNMIKFQLSNGRCCLHSKHVCAKSVTGDKKIACFWYSSYGRQVFASNYQIERDLAWPVLLSTTIFVIIVVKMLWTHEAQPRQATVDLLLSQYRRQIRWFIYAWELIKALRWREQRCLHFYRERQFGKSHCDYCQSKVDEIGCFMNVSEMWQWMFILFF